MKEVIYDIGITGGGLAGLTAAIQLQKKGYRVLLFEKNKYPFHRVCGEYISFESWDFLNSCNIDLSQLQLPLINKLIISAPDGNLLKANLGLGGFGISRFLLDDLLCKEAKRLGVEVFENTKVEDVIFNGTHYLINTNNQNFTVKLALGAFGKRSNLDVKWLRAFVKQKPNTLNNYIGIKYHIKTNFPPDTIALHNFKNGYCGISKVEGDKYCLCYLTTAANLQEHGSVQSLQKNVLQRNPHLKNIFDTSDFLMDKPVSISQISFNNKEAVYNYIPLAGDACGMITPLCGNGMSMAMHAGKLFCDVAHSYLQEKISLPIMLQQYESMWKQQFSKRLQVGRWVQSNFGKESRTSFFISLMKTAHWLTKKIISNTHGNPF